MITAEEIRKRFLAYFHKQGHEVVSSSSLIPKDDPSLLFTNAGMVQFKKVFLGQEHPGYKRATTSQKCLRVGGKHNDLENVGRTARHHTFFEMLGNFSFGDYFKEDAIKFAWEFLTDDLGLPKERMYATVFTDDDEAAELWVKLTDIPAERVLRLGEKDNFWSMGDTGPCGPCSEILVDQGEHMSCGPDCGIGVCDCDRFLEIWNLVFMQYDQIEPGRREPLPKPSIDTGMGLERVAAICQGVNSNFDINLFQEIISSAAELAKVSYGSDEDTNTALRVIADHSRSMAFMIADGILPSNEGRGYVLRRLIRRAYRFGHLLGMNEPFLFKTANAVVERMGEAFPELRDNQDFMARVVKEEEDRFGQTLDKGLAMLEEEMDALKAKNQASISGEFAFKLYDTYGFPIDIINDVAEKQGIGVDEPGFEQLMAEQRERAKAAWKGSGEAGLGDRFKALLEQGVATEFVGYNAMQGQGEIVALLDSAGEQVERLGTSESGYAALTPTPFYGESGGQVGDTAVITTETGSAKVTDTLKPAPELTVAEITVEQGEIMAQQQAEQAVTEAERMATMRNHTATHLLHTALRKVLGDHVKQAGSLVGPDRLRFDFTHIAAMTQEEIAAVEAHVNEAVLQDIPLEIEEMAYDKAIEKGAIALFGEKYTADVRVVSVPGVSVELCGGTHLRATGQIGPFMIQSESGVAAGVRRIEASTGLNALDMINAYRREIEEVAHVVKGRPGDLAQRVKGLQSEIKAQNRVIDELAAKAASAKGGGIMDNVEEIGGVKVLALEVDA
ncbi:MAG: alanine--tRNA ligase, partial [Desulfovibrio sp.]